MKRVSTWIAVWLLATPALANEIDFWVGKGLNSATLVIDWDESPDAGPALSWGYRWDGEARVERMLRDVLTADPRLFAKLSSPDTIGVALYGVGYDRNADEAFGLDDGSQFGTDGVAVSGPSDGALANDPADLYAEGWEFDGFWHNTIASDTQPTWTSAPLGFADQPLLPGDRAGWVFTPYLNPDGTGRTLEELLATQPGEPSPAPPPQLVGDFNYDGHIDAADYTRWRDSHGAAVAVAGAGADADLSSLIDHADYAAWRSAYGTHSTTSAAVPEPAAVWLLLTVSLVLIFTTREQTT